MTVLVDFTEDERFSGRILRAMRDRGYTPAELASLKGWEPEVREALYGEKLRERSVSRPRVGRAAHRFRLLSPEREAVA